MGRIKFYSNTDMTIGYNFNKALDIIKNIKDEEYDINDILEFYNILKIFNEEYLKYVKDESKQLCSGSIRKINSIIGKFCFNINEKNIEDYLGKVDFNYLEDFFEIIDRYKVYKRIGVKKFREILYKKEDYLRFVLQNKDLVNEYSLLIKERLLDYSNSAEFLLEEYEVEHLGKYTSKKFPKDLTNEDKEKILVNYINSDLANLNYLRIIVNLQSTTELNISDRTRLLAKKWAEEHEKSFFDDNAGVPISISVQFQRDLKNTFEFYEKFQDWKFLCNINWIEENIDDNSTLLNYFIHVFEYADTQMRWCLVSKLSYMGIFERSIFMRSKRDYSVGLVFNMLNGLADMQMRGYYSQLQKYDVWIEDLIAWFFDTYLVNEFGVLNFNISLPSRNSNYLEKCRSLLPEIDSCLKQFNYYVEDGIINSELLQISSNHIFFKNVKSLLKNKYVYPIENRYDVIAFYFFSDQCMLKYIERIEEKYNNFYELLLHEKIKKEDIVEYEQTSLQKLIDEQYIYIDENNYLCITNKIQLALLYDIYLNEVISYWRLQKFQRKEIDKLVDIGLLRFESTLFSKPEQNYLNYFLNKSEFNNSLDLRNKYSHGTQPFGNEEVHHSNYIIFLKLFILIIIKINDELCIKDEEAEAKA